MRVLAFLIVLVFAFPALAGDLVRTYQGPWYGAAPNEVYSLHSIQYELPKLAKQIRSSRTGAIDQLLPVKPLAVIIIQEAAGGGGGGFTCPTGGAAELACWDFEATDDATTTGTCDGEIGEPNDTIDKACTDGDCDCEVADADDGEVLELTSDGTNCTIDAANALSWEQAWTSETDNLSYVVGCITQIAGTYTGNMGWGSLWNGAAVMEGSGTTAQFKIDPGVSDGRFGYRAPGQAGGNPSYAAAGSLNNGDTQGFVLEVDTVDDATHTFWVGDGVSTASGGTTAQSVTAADQEFDGFNFGLCESDDAAWETEIQYLYIAASKPSTTPTCPGE